MEKTTNPLSTIIPIVDLSPLMEGDDKSCRKKVMDTISEACNNSGVFLIKNCGVSLYQCKKLLRLTEEFFDYSEEEKIKSTWRDSHMCGSGYNRVTPNDFHDFEYLEMYSPGTRYNGVPKIGPDYRAPPNYLKNYNNDRCWDYMFPIHYTEAEEYGDIGIGRHTDPNLFTLVLRHDVSGLEVYKNGAWISIPPAKGKLVVIVSDITQVLSNKKVKHGTHRALKNTQSDRLAIDFVYSFGPDKLVKPLVDVSTKLGDIAKYREFKYKEFIDMVMVVTRLLKEIRLHMPRYRCLESSNQVSKNYPRVFSIVYRDCSVRNLQILFFINNPCLS